jgi:hypothetical protein
MLVYLRVVARLPDLRLLSVSCGATLRIWPTGKSRNQVNHCNEFAEHARRNNTFIRKATNCFVEIAEL